jgi:hypothetical protein
VPTWIDSLLRDGGRADLVGPAALAELGRIRERVRRDNLLLLARTEQALDALLASGVVPVLLKGADLIHRLYERFDDRTLDDVDLLVERAQLPCALAALERAGWVAPAEALRRHYVRSSHHLPLRSPGAVSVEFELHWNLVQERRFHVEPADLVRRAVPCAVAGRQVLRLEDHDLAAHLLLHHFTHYFDRRLKWAVDLRLVSTGAGFDWALVAERLRAWGASAVGALALAHLAKTVPDWIPDEIRRALPVAGWRRLVTSPLRSTHPLELYRGTRRRMVQLYLAAALLERPAELPGWLHHRRVRERQSAPHPLDNGAGDDDASPERSP